MPYDEKITIKKTVERLSRGLQRFDDEKTIWENYLQLTDKHIDKTTIFAIDNSDLAKKYSVAMEDIHEVHDGSTGACVPGYMTLEIVALTHKHTTPLPVYERVYSAAEPKFVSENDEILKGLKFLSKRHGHSGIRVMDRGYDANVFISYFTEETERFIIRLKKNRNVIYKDKVKNVEQLASQYKGKHKMSCTIYGETVECKISAIPVKLDAFGERIFQLVVVHGLGKIPMLLLTNCNGTEEQLCLAITKMYLLRWRIEEHFRFKKYQYSFEDFRVRRLKAIRNLHMLTNLLTGYMALITQSPTSFIMCKLRLAAKAIPRSSKRRPKKFFHYELAEGFAKLLQKTALNLAAILPPVRNRPSQRQLNFFSNRHWHSLKSFAII